MHRYRCQRGLVRLDGDGHCDVVNDSTLKVRAVQADFCSWEFGVTLLTPGGLQKHLSGCVEAKGRDTVIQIESALNDTQT